MTDIQYLRRATPAQLMKLPANGIPWEFCVLIRVLLLNDSKEAVPEEWRLEKRKWLAAGAVPTDKTEKERWYKEAFDETQACAECGGARYLGSPGHRVTLTREHGFGWHDLCGRCVTDFDLAHYPEELGKLAARWQGRCVARRAHA